MAEPLRKFPLEENSEEKPRTVELEILPGTGLPATTPAFDEEQARRMVIDEVVVAPDLTQHSEGAMDKISHSVKSGLETLSDRSKQVGDKLGDVAGETRDRMQDLAIEAGRRAQDLREAAIDGVRRTRRQARRFANEKPIHAVLAIGGAAFLVGVVLRIWRSSRD